MESDDVVVGVANHLTAWVGELTPNDLAEYLEEPGEADERAPQSRFGADLGLWYDHDWVFAQASETPVSLRDLARANGIEDRELIEEMERRWPKGFAMCFIILWNSKLSFTAEQSFAGGRLKCIGTWPHASPVSD